MHPLALHHQLQAHADQQEQELAHLRRLFSSTSATASDSPQQQQLGAAAAAALTRELDAQRSEVSGWRSKYQQERQLRGLAEGGMQELLGVLDELTLRCDGISSKFAALEQAAAPLPDAKKKGRCYRPWDNTKQVWCWR